MPHGKCHYCGKDARNQLVFGPVDVIDGEYVYACETHYADPTAVIPRSDSREKQKAKQQAVKNQDQWFKYQLSIAGKTCENCNSEIKGFPEGMTEKTKICHILPKAKDKFPSVATHLDNHWTGCWQCHTDFDSSWEKAATMPVIAVCRERMATIYPALTPAEKKKVPKCLKP